MVPLKISKHHTVGAFQMAANCLFCLWLRKQL